MATITFDTLKFARRLKEAGVPESQADAEAEALAEVLEANTGELATKNDLELLRTELKHEMALLRKDFTFLKWMMAPVIAVTVLPALKSLFFGS